MQDLEDIDHNAQVENRRAPQLRGDHGYIQRRDDRQFMTEMSALVDEAESRRFQFMKSYRNRNYIITTITIMSVIIGTTMAAWLFLVHGSLLQALISINLGIIIPIVISLIKNGPIKAYTRQHKKEFLPHLAEVMGGFKYFEKRGISSKIFQKSGIIRPFKDYKAEDCFMGRYKKVKVILCETRFYSDKAAHHPVFEGLSVLIELPKPVFEGHTIITDDPELIRDYSHTRWRSLKPVSLPDDNPDWKDFHIYSNRPEHVDQQVHAPFLKELYEAAQIFDDADISAVMFGKKFLLITIANDEDMFEACDIFMPVTLQSYIKKWKDEINKIMEIIDIYEVISQDLAEEPQKDSGS